MPKNPFLDSGHSEDNSFYEASNRLAEEMYLVPYERKLKNIGLIMIAIGAVLTVFGVMLFFALFTGLWNAPQNYDVAEFLAGFTISSLTTFTGIWILRSGIDMQRLYQSSRKAATVTLLIFLFMFFPFSLFFGIGYLEIIYNKNVASIFKNLNQREE